MRSMTVKEARESFDRMLEAAKRERVVLRDDEADVAMILSPQEYGRFRRRRAEGLLKAMNDLAAEAAANGLAEEKLAELLKSRIEAAVVFDTNVLISAAFYATLATRRKSAAFVYATVHVVNIRRSIRDSRDPGHDKFLEVATNGGAEVLVTGDADPLALNPFEGISIVTPAEYLATMG